MARPDARSHRSDLREDGRGYASPRARLLEAVIAIADADSEDDGTALHAAWCRFRKTLLDLGWTPPGCRLERIERFEVRPDEPDPTNGDDECNGRGRVGRGVSQRGGGHVGQRRCGDAAPPPEEPAGPQS